jgi:hypothetical protein
VTYAEPYADYAEETEIFTPHGKPAAPPPRRTEPDAPAVPVEYAAPQSVPPDENVTEGMSGFTPAPVPDYGAREPAFSVAAAPPQYVDAVRRPEPNLTVPAFYTEEPPVAREPAAPRRDETPDYADLYGDEFAPPPAPRKTGLKIVTLLLAVALFITTLAASGLWLARVYVSGLSDSDAFAVLFDAVGYETLVEEFVFDNEIDIKIRESLTAEAQEKINAEAILELLSGDEVKEQLAALFTDYAQALFDGDGNFKLSREDIVKLVRDNAKLIKSETGYELTDRDYAKLEQALEEDEELSRLLDDYSVDGILEKANINPAVPYLLGVWYPFIAAAALTALVLFNIFYLNRRRTRRALLASSVPFLAVGLPLTLGSLAPLVFSSQFESSTVLRVAAAFSSPVMFTGFAVLGAGILTLAASIILRLLAKNRVERTGSRSGAAFVTVLTVNAVLVLGLASAVLITVLNLPSAK